ncbi:MAG: patatin-like protein [Dehalococcoidia bacterium]|nr:patatin-like protein [Dehalococcoidia bacterium]
MTSQTYHKEIRIALVLYGGVALATYIYGACRELFELVKAARGEKSPYSAIVDDLQANVVVDVISGTSAGGLNGPALAEALAFGTDFLQLEGFWIDEGQIQGLLNNPKRPHLESLINEVYYEEKLREALGRLHAPNDDASMVDSLDVFINTTDLHGRGVAFPGFGGDPIYTKTHERTYHLRYRREGVNDLLDGSHLKLWEMCRATSAFPVAFPPARVVDEDGTRYLSDGGVTNNFPFEQVVDTIATRPADVYVDRALFYVEPDPGFDREAYEGLRGDQLPLAPDDVVVKALFQIPGFESVTEDLNRLQQHNAEVEAHNAGARAIEEWFEQEYRGPGYVTDNRKLDEQWYRGFRESPLSGAYQAMKRVQVHQSITQWLLEGYPRVSGKAISAELERLENTDPAGFYRSFDVGFRVRRFYYLTRELIRVLREVSNESIPGSGQRFASFPSRVEEGTLLRELLAKKAGLLGLVSRAREIPGAVRRELGDLPLKDDASLKEYMSRARAAYEGLFNGLAREGEAAVREIDAVLRGHGREASATFELMADSFELRDAFLFPSTYGRGLGERDYVELVPITPAKPTFIDVPQESKLAGESLFHFGGFLSKEWRKNDIMWGRLDAAETIVRFLMPRIPEERRRPLEEYVRPIQEAIVRTYTSFTPGSGAGQDYRDYLKNSYRVGGQTISDLPPEQMVPLAVQTLGVLHGMMENLQAERSNKPVLGTAYAVMARGLGYINRILNPAACLLFPGSSLVKRAIALLLFLGLGWTVGTFAIEIAGFQDLKDSTLVLAGLIGLIAITVGGFYYRLTWRRFAVLSVVLLALGAALFLDLRYPDRVSDIVDKLVR